MALDYKFKALNGTFPRKLTPSDRRDYSRFGKTWKQVQEILERELRALHFRPGSVELMTGHSDWDVRNDGKLRSDARKAEHPGVVVRFDVYREGRYYKMSFECDKFVDWKANVRAIADAMEALRKVDRYAVTGGGKSSAHYEGYKALPSAEGKVADKETAAEFIANYSEFSAASMSDKAVLSRAYKQAAIKLHPDNRETGDKELFHTLMDAYNILGN